jgi:flagellar assembly protein FliH
MRGAGSSLGPCAEPQRPGAERQSPCDQEIADRIRRAHEAGFQEGQAAGVERLRAEKQEATSKLARAIADLAGYKDRLRRDAERDLVMLSVEIARRLVHREIAADPEAILGIVHASLAKIEAREVYRVRTHPSHAPAIQAALSAVGSPQRIEVVPDAALEQGALLFETGRGTFDASVHTQLEEIKRGFTDLLAGAR